MKKENEATNIIEEIQFDYFHGMEADQYSFYRIPKLFFTTKYFKKLSCEARILYGLMLNRMSLSIKNRWLDEYDHVYIIFTIKDIMELMDCSRQKAVKTLAEPATDKGMGLILSTRFIFIIFNGCYLYGRRLVLHQKVTQSQWHLFS